MTGDTFDRSLAHWSEAGRAGMEAFYQVATLDYRELARAWDWHHLLRDRLAQRAPVRVLDVACGSGRFPAALCQHTDVARIDGAPIVVDLLDPSPFSLAEARAALRPPLWAGRDFECTLQDLPADATGYDLMWAVHALYALPGAELADGVAAFLRALAPDGLGFIAHATREAHYLAFHDAYLQRFQKDDTPFTDAATIAAAFGAAGADVEVHPLRYQQVIRDEQVLEGFLQRCLFDETLSLAAMRADETLGAYLAARTDPDGAVRLDQEVAMMFIRHPG